MMGAAVATLVAQGTVATLLWFQTIHPDPDAAGDAGGSDADETDVDPLRAFDDQ